MSIFSKLGKWVKEKAAPIAKAVLPVAGFAVGLVAPGVGAAIGKVADTIGNKIKDVTGIGDGKPGVLGFGDGLPGILGIGTGKAALEKLKKENYDLISQVEVKLKKGEPLSAPEKLAYEQAKRDMKSEGINPLYLIGGALLGLLALRK